MHSTCDMLSLFPEEILVYVLSFLQVSDLYSSCRVSTVWRRLCEDEFIFRSICRKNYPCLLGATRPPFEDSWRHFYTARKGAFCVLGGPVSQASCMEDICGKLRAAGLPHVDGIFAQKRIPTLQELQRYCAVLVYSYNSSAFMDGTLMGDLLADYVDNGGGVVVTVFTNCNNLRNGFIKGRFLEGGYHPILPARQHDTNGKRPLIMGKIHETSHPIMAGIRTLDGGRASFFCPGALHPDAKLVADWSNGVPLVAELRKPGGLVTALNFFPPSSDTGDSRFWQSNTDGGQLLANALAYSGRSAVLRRKRPATSYLSPRSDKVAYSRDAQGNWHEDKGASQIDKKDKRHKAGSSARVFGRRLLARWFPSKKSDA